MGLNPTVQGAQAALRQAHEETLKMLATYKVSTPTNLAHTPT